MPWCPQCKMEYRTGITQCADCGTPLVESLDGFGAREEAAACEREEAAQKLTNYLLYSHVDSAAYSYSEENETWIVTTAASHKKEAQKLCQGFFLGEMEENKKTQVEIPSEQISAEKIPAEQIPAEKIPAEEVRPVEKQTEGLPEGEAAEEDPADLDALTKNLRSAPASSYVKKGEKYQDLKSTAWMFLLFGALILVFLALHLLKVVTLLSGALTYTLLALLGIGMIYVGITSFIRAKKTAAEAIEEEAVSKEINAYLKEHVTKEYIYSLPNDSLSEEINFLNKMERIKEDVRLRFGDLNDAYLDQIVEEFYDELENIL